jgi:peptide deformylase
MQIVKFPNSILREKMPEFDFNNPITDARQLEEDMLKLMYASDGMGLSANQVGIRARVFVMGHNSLPENGQAFFNPIIVANTDDLSTLEEGCLSFPGIYTDIKRPSAIKAKWQNSKGGWEEGEFRGYECRCFLHEYDHLEGIVFQDRVSPIRWAMAIKKSKPKTKRK